MRSNGIALHYTNNSEAIKSDYLNHLRDAALL